MHTVLGDLRKHIQIDFARVLVLAGGQGHTSHVFDSAELYRCECAESETADLVADPSDLFSIPDRCFEFVVADHRLVGGPDPALVASEMWRVLMPGGHLLVPTIMGHSRDLVDFLESRSAMRSLPAFDPVTRQPGALHLWCKEDGGPPARPSEADEPVTGYAYHLSRRSGRRIVFCLNGLSVAGNSLPIQALSGEIVGEVATGSRVGHLASPPEPWAEGLRLPPRAAFELDPSLPSGIYTLAGTIPFINRSRDRSGVAILIPSNTANAFSDAGGRSLYATSHTPAADTLSIHRPIEPQLLLNGCWPFAKWFEKANPYPTDTTYLIDSDLDQPGALDGVEVLVVIGRSEYWTRAARECFDAHIDGGGRALLLCSELMHWQVRVDLARQQLLRFPIGEDEHPDPLLHTRLWHDPLLEYPIYPKTGCELWHGGARATDGSLGWDGMRIVCPDSPLLRGSGLSADDVVWLPDATEWDGAPIGGSVDGVPQVDFGDEPPWRHEVIGYNHVNPAVDELPPGQPATSLWIALRRTSESGTVVHCGSMAWCGPRAVGDGAPDGERNRGIVLEMLRVLYEDEWAFST